MNPFSVDKQNKQTNNPRATNETPQLASQVLIRSPIPHSMPVSATYVQIIPTASFSQVGTLKQNSIIDRPGIGLQRHCTCSETSRFSSHRSTQLPHFENSDGNKKQKISGIWHGGWTTAQETPYIMANSFLYQITGDYVKALRLSGNRWKPSQPPNHFNEKCSSIDRYKGSKTFKNLKNSLLQDWGLLALFIECYCGRC